LADIPVFVSEQNKENITSYQIIKTPS